MASPPSPSGPADGRIRGQLRDRAAASNQLVLCAVVGVLFFIGIATASLTDGGLFGIAVLLVVLGGVAGLAVPWSRLPPHAVIVLPVVDIVAIALMRLAEPNAAFGLLWVFPAMWLSVIGRAGFAISVVGIPVVYWCILWTGASPTGTYAVVLLPVVIVAVSVACYLSSRRFRAQRTLLDRQAVRVSAAHREALRQEQLVSEVLDTVDFGVIRLSAAGEVVLENDALLRFGRIPGFLPGGAGDSAVTDEKLVPLDPQQHPLVRLQRQESFDDVVLWFALADGRRRAFAFAGRHLTDHNGAPAGAVLIARDVTAERDAQRVRDDLVTSVSHELRTPLTSILGYLELVLDGGGLSDAARRHVETAHRNSERLLGIVTDILSASSRSGSSIDTRLHPRVVDMTEIVRAAAAGLEPVAEGRFVDLRVEESGAAEAYADPTRIRQVIDNLLANAVKFNRDGGRVTASTSTDGVHTTVRVADTGIGMAPDAAARVFERFFRAVPSVPGNGLGLTITRDLVAAHGGSIAVESTAGEGSVFTVVLPATREVFDRETSTGLPPGSAELTDKDGA
ncbi:MAG: two-component sensor histidine kinase [Microbacterium sp. 69-7]|mgnify:CR=1 FL=1|uniref:PAS domain-containing sensor histidine kinase n=1 Tax=Microbacterium sp. 69-7 TaxID=1895784 RepID=UPI00095CB1FF|nr:PAS domain-containing sensor histidine kinase [Microbacterium sp. 69-7]OJU45833.1 MAG: two-component sensor histidine kinase [Microbacterium sp. 69-7]